MVRLHLDSFLVTEAQRASALQEVQEVCTGRMELLKAPRGDVPRGCVGPAGPAAGSELWFARCTGLRGRQRREQLSSQQQHPGDMRNASAFQLACAACTVQMLRAAQISLGLQLAAGSGEK